MKYILLLVAGVLALPIISLVFLISQAGPVEIDPKFLLLLTVLTPFILALGLYKIIFVLEQIRDREKER